MLGQTSTNGQPLQVEGVHVTFIGEAGSTKKTWLLRLGLGFGCFALGVASAMAVAPPASYADSLHTPEQHGSAVAFMPLTRLPSVMPSRVHKAPGSRPSGPNMGFVEPARAAARSRTSAIPFHSSSSSRTSVKMTAEAAPAAGTKTFYTDAVKQDSYRGLPEVLEEHMADKELRVVISDLFDACGTITDALRQELVCVADEDEQCSVFGDIQLGVDLLADDLLWEECKRQPLIKEGASEESPDILETHKDGKFSIAWDPLDGSSIVDNNWAVGTIIGVWPASTGIIGATGHDQVTSIVAVYGPRTTIYVALDDGVYEFTYGAGGVKGWVASKEKIRVREESQIYSPGGMRGASEVAGYDDLLAYWKDKKYIMRFTGGMVPDVCQQFTKGEGIFAHPSSKEAPAKLRLAFEAAPLGFLVEKAGGTTSAMDGSSILDTKITGIEQKVGFAMGSKKEVDRFKELVVNKQPK